jgi:filamin
MFINLIYFLFLFFCEVIWMLILKYQISKSEYGDDANAGPKKALLEWANSVLNPQGVYVKDFTTSWQDGAGFCGLVNAIEPGSIDLSQLNLIDADEKMKNLNKGFETGEEKFGIAHLLDAEDVLKAPDELSVMSYVSLYRAYLAQVSPDASKCTAEGPGLVGGKTKKKCEFTVITRNEEGELIKRGGAKVTAIIKGPDGKDQKCTIKDNFNGTYAGSYEVKAPGQYQLDIFVVGKPVADSPFHPTITPSGPHASYSYAHGPGVEQAVSGEETHFTITSVDEAENELTEGGSIFPSSFVDAASGETLPINVVDNQNGKYTAKYTPKTAGKASVIVLLKNEDGEESPIKGSPYVVLVLPGDLAVDNVTITGQGLERVVAGEVGEFFVQAKDANLNPLTNGDHALTASLDGPSDVNVDVLNNQDGTYKGSFVPTKVGDYTLDVAFDGDKKVPGAPFKVQVVPASPSAENTIASGEGLNKAEAGVPGHFQVEVRDRFDNPVGHGGDAISASIAAKDDESAAAANVVVKDNGDGTYTVEYDPINKVGDYVVQVKLSESDIKDAPFALAVSHSSKGSDPEKSFVVDLGDAIAGETQHPVIHSVDEFGNLIAGGGDNVEVALSGPEDVEVTVKDNGDGTYTADYRPTKAGEYKAVVKINGNEVKDSPFTFTVSPAAVNAGHCVASGPGITRGKADKDAPFKVQLRDEFDNDILSNPGVTCEAAIVLQEKRRAHEYPDSSDDEGKEKPAAPADEDPRTVVAMNDNADGTFNGAYKLKAAGNYILEITVDGSPVKDAPFTIKGNPGRPHVPNTVVRGARKGKAGVDGARVILKDAQGNVRHKGGQKVHAKLVAKRDPELIEAIDNGDGSFTVPYPADAKGKYGMALFCGDESIPGDFGLDVSETPLTEEESEAITSALPGSGATVANLLKQAPLAEREKFASELNALRSGAPAPVAAAPVEAAAPAPAVADNSSESEARAQAAEQQAQAAEEKAAAAAQQAAAAEERAQAAEQAAHAAEQNALASESKISAVEAEKAALASEVESLKAQLAAAQSAPVAAAPAETMTEAPQEAVTAEEDVEEAASAAPQEEQVVADEPAPESPKAPVEEPAPESPKAPVVAEEEEPVSPKKSKKSKSSKSLKAAEVAPEPEPEPVAAAPAADKKKSKSKSKKKK